MDETLECGAVLFDLDGVLVDSSACVARVWERWADRHGMRAADFIRFAQGRRTIETVRLIAPHLDAAAETAMIAVDEDRERDGLEAFVGAADLLRAVAHGRWAVV